MAFETRDTGPSKGLGGPVGPAGGFSDMGTKSAAGVPPQSGKSTAPTELTPGNVGPAGGFSDLSTKAPAKGMSSSDEAGNAGTANPATGAF